MGLLIEPPRFTDYVSNASVATLGSPGTTVNHPGAPAHTKNTTWTQLIASTGFDAQLIVVTISAAHLAASDSSTLLDIGIGAAGSEAVLIPDLMAGFGHALEVGTARHYIFPLRIPSGSRISARTQSVRTTGSINVLVELWGGAPSDLWWSGSQVTAYGINAANSAGTKVLPGGSSAEGTAVEIATTATAHRCMVFGMQGHPDDITWSASHSFWDLGIGSAATEWIANDQWFAAASANEAVGTAGTPWWPVFYNFAAGVALMVRARSSVVDQPYSVGLYGVS